MTPPDGLPSERGMLVRSALAGLLICLLTAGATATAALLQLERIWQSPGGGGIVPVRITPAKPGKPQTILLLGSDRRRQDRKGDPVRSDTMMLVRLSPQAGATTVMSIPRDLRADLPGHGMAKVNDAYALGGPALAVETITALTGLRIHHVVDVDFRGFRSAIDRFGCFYADVDRRYFHSNRDVPVGQRYDAIDIQPGYQRLCGNDALDYVRFRHADSDLTRAARQQDFLRAAKDQISTSQIIDDLGGLARIVARSTQTDRDLRTTGGFVRLAKLVLRSADLPVRQVPFPATFVKERDGEDEIDYVDASPAQIRRAAQRFLRGGRGTPRTRQKTPAGTKRRARQAKIGVIAAGLVDRRQSARNLLAAAGRGARSSSPGFPLRYPSHLTPRGRYEEPLRRYGLRDRSGALHRAYRLVVAESRIDGQFYGVQGTTWRNPPLLGHPSGFRRARGRRLELFRAGSRLRLVAWRTPTAVYWISNTLNLKLTNAEMLALAASLTTSK